MADERERLVAEVARLEGLMESLERDWQRIPKLFGTAILAVPVGFVWGVPAAIFVVGLAASLVGVGVYLVGVRRNEYRSELEQVQERLAEIDGTAGGPGRRRSGRTRVDER